jgi:hypothetical protein
LIQKYKVRVAGMSIRKKEDSAIIAGYRLSRLANGVYLRNFTSPTALTKIFII